MVKISGISGLMATGKSISKLTAPPYDVIKEGTQLWGSLKKTPESLFHVTLGEKPLEALSFLLKNNYLVKIKKPVFVVYEQRWGGGRRIGLFAAVQVHDYYKPELDESKRIIRHEKTFPEKVAGRVALAKKLGYTAEPVFLLTKAGISAVLDEISLSNPKDFSIPPIEFKSSFAGETDLNGISTKLFFVEDNSAFGKKLIELALKHPMYIADGHHRYEAALQNQQKTCLAYVVERADILAYDRLITPRHGVNIKNVLKSLKANIVPCFETPLRHSFCIYTKAGIYQYSANADESNPIERLDCRILERTLYEKLGLSHDDIMNLDHFYYLPENQMETMKRMVDMSEYQMAAALHPVSISELMAVADAGLIMPEKSTFFSPKILSGIVLLKQQNSTDD